MRRMSGLLDAVSLRPANGQKDIRYRSLVDYRNPHSLGSRLRLRRRYHLERLIESIFERQGYVRILDIGGVRNYWKMFDDSYLLDRKVHVTLANLENDTLENLESAKRDELGFKAVMGDGCNLPAYKDNSFDLTHSNSTIEHVGTWEQM